MEWAQPTLTLLSEAKDAAPIIASIAALIAVILGPTIQIYILKRQQRTSIVSANRIRWIEDLRKEISEFCASYELYEVQKRFLRQAINDKDTNMRDHYWKAVDESFFKVKILLNSLNMKLNQKNSVEKDLFDTLMAIDRLEVDDFEYDLYKYYENVTPLINKALNLSKIHLKSEWERAKLLR